MTTDRDRAVRERAYHLWVENGRQHGQADDHWGQAERELSTEASGPPKPARAKTPAPRPTPSAGKASKPAAPSAAVSPKTRARPMPASPKP